MHSHAGNSNTVGHDIFGRWCVLTVAGVQVKLRWIGPGEFHMGSPAQEHARTPDEGPQHTVRISSGFWLFETLLTQAMWKAVGGHNPSHFRSPNRPVEGVSFRDVQWFLAQANSKLKDVRLSLPSEAQWEYACRAGTTGATWRGELQLEGINNAPVLQDIGWYAGNASFAFKESHGVDSSSWQQCEYLGARAGTHVVGLKEPNPWGLYDMLGNVWEWCSDSMRDYSLSSESESVVDPLGDTDNEVHCARGGSWRDSPAKLRAAYRDQIELGYKNDFVGFRCVVEFAK